MAVIDAEEDDKALVYVKGCEKREWWIYSIRFDHWEDIDFLNNLDVTNTMWCIKHVKNCELQNVFKIYNWWLQRQKGIYESKSISF